MTKEDAYKEFIEKFDFSYDKRRDWPTINDAFFAGWEASKKEEAKEEEKYKDCVEGV